MPRLLSVLLFILFLATPAAAQLIGDVIDAPVSVSPPHVTEAAKRTAFVFEGVGTEVAFNGIALQGFATGATLEGAVRFAEAGKWSAWHDLYIVRSATDAAFLAAYRDETVRAAVPFEIRFSVETGERVLIGGAGVFDTRLDGKRAETPPQVPGPQPKATVITAPTLHNRAEWGAKPFIRGTPQPLAPSGYNRMTFHHAAGFGAQTLAEGLEQVRLIQEFHQNGRGWSDIGYQFVMDERGRIYQGRPFLDGSTTLDEIPRLALGAHVGGHNTGNIGVCVLGCYHPPEGSFCQDNLSTTATDSLITMFAFLSENYGVHPEMLGGHRDLGSTACPGNNNYEMLPAIRTSVTDLLITGEIDRPDTYTLAASFPNPSTGPATIRYFLEQEGRVTLRLFDALGREVAMLVDDFRDEGQYELPVDVSNLPSGTYFYRLQVEGFAGTVFDDTKALVLTR